MFVLYRHEEGGMKPLQGLSVLIVDDAPDIRLLVGLALRRGGALVTEAESAEEAYRSLSVAVPDVLVCDIGMPGEDGLSLIRRIRARERAEAREHLPAAALTAFTTDHDRDEALAAGFEVHLPKPIDPVWLVGYVRALAERRTIN